MLIESRERSEEGNALPKTCSPFSLRGKILSEFIRTGKAPLMVFSPPPSGGRGENTGTAKTGMNLTELLLKDDSFRVYLPGARDHPSDLGESEIAEDSEDLRVVVPGS